MSNESLRLYCVRSYNEPPLLHAPCFVFICSSSADFARSLFCATVRSSMISLNLRHAAQRLARASATLQCSGIGSRHSGRGAAWLQQCARPRRDAFKVNGTRLAQLHRSGPRTTSSSPPTTPSSLVLLLLRAGSRHTPPRTRGKPAACWCCVLLLLPAVVDPLIHMRCPMSRCDFTV